MQSMKHMDISETFFAQDKMVHANLQNNNKEALREAPHPFTLMNQMGQKCGRFEPEIKVLHVLEEHKNNISAQHYENSLFSSSLSDLFSRKMRLSSYNDICGNSIGNAAPPYQEEEPLELSKEIEAQTIGNLLPDDDDLLAGLTDGLDINVLSGSCDDIEDMDLFSNIGGMDLEEDISSTEHKWDEYFEKGFTALNGVSSAEHIYGELPSRTLFVRNINSNFEDFELQSLFELYGEIHTLDTTRKNHGAVMITYYDLRSACNAMIELRSKSLKHMKLEIHFYSLKDKIDGSDINQGLVAVYNFESSISNDELHSIFGIYGEIKEIHENAQPSPRKFIEFYDIRAAKAALNALNSFDSMGKEIKIELPHPGGARRSLTQNHSTGLDHEVFKNMISSAVNSAGRAESVSLGTIGTRTNGHSMGAHTSFRAPIGHFAESSFHLRVSNSVPKNLPSLVGVESFSTQQQACPVLSHSPAHILFEYQGGPGLHPHSLPNDHDIFPFNNSGNMAASLPGSGGKIMNRQLIGLTTNSFPMEMNGIGRGNLVHPGSRYSWNNSPNPHHASMVLPNSPSVANGFQPPQRLHGLPRAPTLLPNRVVPVTSHHVGSAPAINPSLWEMQHAFSGESVEGSSIHPDSFGNLRISNSSSVSVEFVPRNVFPHTGGSFHGSPIQSKGMGFHSHQQRCVMFPSRSPMGGMMNSFDSSNETIRFRRNENVSSQTENKKQFVLDIDRILQGEDRRTTLMIKNIPNKYTSKMLLAAIDERHKGSYDFIYLPIDFKNKCNVGYAFINMTEPKSIVPFYQAFNGKKWEKFNSEKVASIAYARIQGKAALVAHFQNSSLMNEDKRCRPILFNSDGPNAGDQVPFPMGINIRPRMGKTRTSISNADQGSPPCLANGEGFCASDSSSGSARDSD